MTIPSDTLGRIDSLEFKSADEQYFAELFPDMSVQLWRKIGRSYVRETIFFVPSFTQESLVAAMYGFSEELPL